VIRETGTDFIIRAGHNRRIASEGGPEYLFDPSLFTDRMGWLLKRLPPRVT
jgi:hypothetical protein